MFGYAGRSESDVRELHSGLKRACENDPTLAGIAKDCSRHCHGWGYVIHAANGLFHYRTAKSIYEDDAELPKLEGDIRAIFHGRFASDESLVANIFSHPFVASTDEEILFLAHNGGVSPDHLAARKVDSEWALDQIVQAGGLDQALAKLKEHTISSLNLLVLSIARSNGTPATLRGLNYFKFREEKAKANYYTMYLGTMPGGRAFVSSTFNYDGAKVNGLTITSPATFGEPFTLAP
jgi:predicted glutamine amidotransferase